PMARDNRTLGKFHLVGIPPAPRQIPQIEVTFDIDANGILNVAAQDKATGKQQNITITASSGLTKDEIDRMMKEAEANSAEDSKRKQEIEVRNQTDSLVYSTERTLGEHGAKLAENDRKAIDDALAEAREALKGEDVERMKRAQDGLSRASHKLAEIMYREAQTEGRRGDDVHAVVELSFAGVVRGTSVRLDVQRFSPCSECRASGSSNGARCAACLGRGVRRVVESVLVGVPAGVDSGAQIRVAGEGNAGPFGGPRGDLIVSTRVGEHPFFRRKGDSVHCEVPISVWEALLGARIRVPTPSGEAVLVVPPGTTGSQVFRLRGQGLPRLTGESTGDLYATVRVEVPTGLDARTHELVRQLARLMPVETRTALERYRGGAE